jgi:Anti-sigma-K factor rskA/Putative zinc-finger
MSGCRDRGDDVGAYVLGALEPAEMEAMRRHLETCARCAAEERALAGLPDLLNRVQADVEPPPLSPRLEDEVLDRFVRERAEETTPPAGRRRFALPAIAAAALVLALAVFLWPADEKGAYARTEMRGHGAWAAASVDAVDSGTRVRIEANDLPRGAYELWCVRTDGRWISGGSFRARGDGSADAELTAAVRPGEYHTVVITRRSSMGARGAEVMRGELRY